MAQRGKGTHKIQDFALDQKRTRELLRNLVEWRASPDTFESVRLDKAAVASFIAEQAVLLSAIAHAAGHSTAKILCDVLYVNTVKPPNGITLE